eukprot:g9802.t1
MSAGHLSEKTKGKQMRAKSTFPDGRNEKPAEKNVVEKLASANEVVKGSLGSPPASNSRKIPESKTRLAGIKHGWQCGNILNTIVFFRNLEVEAVDKIPVENFMDKYLKGHFSAALKKVKAVRESCKFADGFVRHLLFSRISGLTNLPFNGMAAPQKEESDGSSVPDSGTTQPPPNQKHHSNGDLNGSSQKETDHSNGDPDPSGCFTNGKTFDEKGEIGERKLKKLLLSTDVVQDLLQDAVYCVIDSISRKEKIEAKIVIEKVAKSFTERELKKVLGKITGVTEAGDIVHAIYDYHKGSKKVALNNLGALVLTKLLEEYEIGVYVSYASTNNGRHNGKKIVYGHTQSYNADIPVMEGVSIGVHFASDVLVYQCNGYTITRKAKSVGVHASGRMGKVSAGLDRGSEESSLRVTHVGNCTVNEYWTKTFCGALHVKLQIGGFQLGFSTRAFKEILLEYHLTDVETATMVLTFWGLLYNEFFGPVDHSRDDLDKNGDRLLQSGYRDITISTWFGLIKKKEKQKVEVKQHVGKENHSTKPDVKNCVKNVIGNSAFALTNYPDAAIKKLYALWNDVKNCVKNVIGNSTLVLTNNLDWAMKNLFGLLNDPKNYVKNVMKKANSIGRHKNPKVLEAVLPSS